MQSLKKKLFRFFFAAEVQVFIGVYIAGAQGVPHIWRLKKEIDMIQQEKAHLQGRVQRITRYTYYCLERQCLFSSEKYARVHLQMARADEEIFLY